VDTLAGDTMESETLKLVYETILNMAYALFLVGVMISLATDDQTRTSFIDYLGRSSSVAYLIVMLVLGVLNYSLNLASKKEKKYAP
jgi:hypothetical protein